MDPKSAIAKVETYTTAEVMGASKQEYKGMIIVTQFVDLNAIAPDGSRGGYRPPTNQDRANQVKQWKKFG